MRTGSITRNSLLRSDFTDVEWAEMHEDPDFFAAMRPAIEKLAGICARLCSTAIMRNTKIRICYLAGLPKGSR
jgi:hypothetical protein